MHYFEAVMAVVDNVVVFWFLHCVVVKLADVSEKVETFYQYGAEPPKTTRLFVVKISDVDIFRVCLYCFRTTRKIFVFYENWQACTRKYSNMRATLSCHYLF